MHITREGKTLTDSVRLSVFGPLFLTREGNPVSTENGSGHGLALCDCVGSLGDEPNDTPREERCELLRCCVWVPGGWVMVAGEDDEVGAVTSKPAFDRVLHAEPVCEPEDIGEWYLSVKIVEDDSSLSIVSVEPDSSLGIREGNVVDVRETLSNPEALAARSRSVQDKYSSRVSCPFCDAPEPERFEPCRL